MPVAGAERQREDKGRGENRQRVWIASVEPYSPLKLPSLHSFTTANVGTSVYIYSLYRTIQIHKVKMIQNSFLSHSEVWGNGIAYEFPSYWPVWNVLLQGLLTLWMESPCMSVGSMTSRFDQQPETFLSRTESTHQLNIHRQLIWLLALQLYLSGFAQFLPLQNYILYGLS